LRRRWFAEQGVDGLHKGGHAEVGQVAGGLSARLLMLALSVHEAGLHPQSTTKFNIWQGVAHHQARLGGDVWKIALSLFEESWQWLATVTLVPVMGAKVEAVNVG